MPDQKLRQLQYEADTWKRLLGFMMDENIYLKNRVSEILRNNFDRIHLDEIDDFQNRSVKADQLIGLLRNEVAELDKLLTREVFEDGQIIHLVQEKLARVRGSIGNAEKNLAELKVAFNNYILDAM